MKKDLDVTNDNLVEHCISAHGCRSQIPHYLLYFRCVFLHLRSHSDSSSALPFERKRIKSLPIVAAKSSGSQTEEAVSKIQT